MVNDLMKWVEDSDLLNERSLSELRHALESYPYCQPLHFLYLKNLYQLRHPDFFTELSNSSVFISDRRKLFYYLAIREELWNEVFEFYSRQKDKNKNKETAAADTFAMIDSFLQDHAPAMLQQTTRKPTQKAARMAMATQDYASLLVSDEDGAAPVESQNNTPLKHQSLIDDFIEFANTGDSIRETLTVQKEDQEEVPLHSAKETDILDDDDLLTESLAKIYIKQKRYYKAIEIIKKLSLKYPEKSIYFADQIRFLEKLISNIKKA